MFNAKETAKGVKAYIGACKANSLLPTVEGLAVQLQVARSTIYKWADDHPAFSGILELLLSQQAARLIQNGVTGAYNSTITKLMLTKHGYSDKSDITSGGAPINPLSESNQRAITELRDLLKQSSAQRRARHCRRADPAGQAEAFHRSALLPGVLRLLFPGVHQVPVCRLPFLMVPRHGCPS